jgi:hypothetical protein
MTATIGTMTRTDGMGLAIAGVEPAFAELAERHRREHHVH